MPDQILSRDDFLSIKQGVDYDSVSTVHAARAKLARFRESITAGETLRVEYPDRILFEDPNKYDQWVYVHFPIFESDEDYPIQLSGAVTELSRTDTGEPREISKWWWRSGESIIQVELHSDAEQLIVDETLLAETRVADTRQLSWLCGTASVAGEPRQVDAFVGPWSLSAGSSIKRRVRVYVDGELLERCFPDDWSVIQNNSAPSGFPVSVEGRDWAWGFFLALVAAGAMAPFLPVPKTTEVPAFFGMLVGWLSWVWWKGPRGCATSGTETGLHLRTATTQTVFVIAALLLMAAVEVAVAAIHSATSGVYLVWPAVASCLTVGLALGGLRLARRLSMS